MIHENPYQAPKVDPPPFAAGGGSQLSGDGRRLAKSLATWMRIVGVGCLLAGAMQLAPIVHFLREPHVAFLGWMLPDIILLVAGICLLRTASAFARVSAAEQAVTIGDAFVRLRWYLVATGLVALLQSVLFHSESLAWGLP